MLLKFLLPITKNAFNAANCQSRAFQNISSLLNHPAIHEFFIAIGNEPTLLENEIISNLIKQRLEIEKELHSLSSITDKDVDMLKLIEEEKESYGVSIHKINHEILLQMLPSPENRDVALEVTAGVGGKEAMHFASELFGMYSRYCSLKGWDWEVQEIDVPESGGIRHASAYVSGTYASTYLMQEAGVHRVQRVPSTEKSGRVHTSTATVAILPQPTDLEIVINDKDIKMETKTSSGAGGQHVNKTESCVRLTHLPTGIVIENQTDRSQIKNRQIALRRLRLKLYQMEVEGIESKTTSARKEQVGSSSRSEKIRTYNYNQDRVTDHRIGMSLHNLEGFLEGSKDLDNLVSRLVEHSRERELLHIIAEKLKELKLKHSKG